MTRLTKQDIIVIAICFLVAVGYPAAIWMIVRMWGG